MNYIEFETAIPYFRKTSQETIANREILKLNSSFYILTDFKIHQDFLIDDCTVLKSQQVFLDTNTYANISEVIIPNWIVNHSNGEIACASFTLVFSSLISLATERNVKFFSNHYNISTIESIASQLPLQHSGPGAIDKPTETDVEEFMKAVSDVYSLAHQLEDSNYLTFIRSCRLFQLAKNTLPLDHNLGYSLMVSCIESNADNAIKPKEVKYGWSDIKKRIKKVADEAELEQEFRDILYQKLNHHYSGKRFKKFITDYAPFESLNLKSRYDKMGLFQEEKDALEPMDRQIDPINYFIHENRKNSELLDILEKGLGIKYDGLLGNTYSYRSKFYHAGEAEIHNRPDNFDRYIKTVVSIEDEQAKSVYMISFNLLAQIARSSSINYYKKQTTGAKNP